jgi:hypothetical protein
VDLGELLPTAELDPSQEIEMRKQIWTASLLAATLLLALGTTPVVAQSVQEDPTGEALGDDYADGDFGRLSHQENGVTIRRASTESDPSLERVAGLNAPIFPGDGLMTAFDQRAEVQLAGGSLVRVDRASDLTFLALPDPYAEIVDNTILQLQQGTIRIQALLANDSEFRIDTPSASIFLLGDSDVRIEADEDGSTRIASRRGVVEVSANGDSVLVRGGNETVVYPGVSAENPTSFNTLRADGFDRWVYEREALWNDQERFAGNNDAYQELPNEVRPYYRELSANGRWTYIDDIGWSWYPNGVASDWRPYNDGYWSHGDRGYFWVSHERWGWAPYHYGRWHYSSPFGWSWVPGRTFGGAWVAWSVGSAYLGWSPLGYWNSPYCGSQWAYSYGYYGPSWTFLNYNYLGRRNYRRYAVSYARLGSRHLNGAAVVTRPPRTGPRALSRSAELRDSAVRQARGNRAAAIRPISREARGRTTLPEVDRRLASMRGERATASRGRGGRAVDDGRTIDRGARRTPQKATGRRSLTGDERANTGRGTSLQRRSTEKQSTPGRTTGTAGATGRRTTRPSDDRAVRGGSGSTRGNTRATSPSRSNSGNSRRADTPQRRIRDVYERMSTGRSSSDSPSNSSARSKESPTDGSNQRATPRSPSSSSRQRSTAPRSTAPRSGRSGSRQKATTPSRSSSPRPSVTPRRPSGGSKATQPSRSRSGGGSKATQPSRSRSGGGSKASRPSSSRSDGKKRNGRR